MNNENVLNSMRLVRAIEIMPLLELYDVQNSVSRAIEKQKKQLIASVSVQKKNYMTTILTHPTNGSYVVKPVAFRGRLRMWKMVQGQRGLKQGPVVVREAMGDLDSLKIQIALGHHC